MKNHKVFLLVVSLLIVTLACGTSTPPPPTATTDPNQVATAVEATLLAQAGSPVPPQATTQAPPTNPPPGATTAPPAVQPTATPTPSPACLPQHPGAMTLSLPAGLTASYRDQEIINMVNFQGQIQSARNVPGLSWADTGEVHIAGTLSQGINAIPIIYRTWTNSGNLYQNINNGNSLLANTPDLVILSGAPAQPVIAYSTSESTNNGWVSRLYVGNLSAFPNLSYVHSRDQDDFYVILPLGVRAANGQAQGVWFTLSLYGIGNIIFHPYNGLYYFDLSANQVTEFLAFNNVIAGLSPDQSMVAYGPGPAINTTGLYFRNLVTCQETFIPRDPGSNLGVGWAVFSPNNQSVAWIEATGPDTMSATRFMRIANTANGSIIAEAHAANLSGLAGGEALDMITPVGWADNNQVLVELGLVNWDFGLIVRMEPNFHNPLHVADGGFTGFYYP